MRCAIACGPTRVCSAKNDRRRLHPGRRRSRHHPGHAGEAKLAQEFANALLKEGIYVTGFFYPVVPKGQARIRTQMSADHTPEQIERAVAAFTRIGKDLGVIA